MLSASSARRGVKIGGGDHRRGGVPRQQQRRAGAIHGKAAHGKRRHKKRPTEKSNKKEVGAAAGRVYLFFRVNLPGRVLDYSPGPLSSPSGGVNPSRAILSRVAVKMYPCTLSPI